MVNRNGVSTQSDRPKNLHQDYENSLYQYRTPFLSGSAICLRDSNSSHSQRWLPLNAYSLHLAAKATGAQTGQDLAQAHTADSQLRVAKTVGFSGPHSQLIETTQATANHVPGCALELTKNQSIEKKKATLVRAASPAARGIFLSERTSSGQR